MDTIVGGTGGAGGDVLCVVLYTGRCLGRAQFEFESSIVIGSGYSPPACAVGLYRT